MDSCKECNKTLTELERATIKDSKCMSCFLELKGPQPIRERSVWHYTKIYQDKRL